MRNKLYLGKRIALPSTDLSKIANKEYAEPGIYLNGREIIISNGKRYIDTYLTSEEAREFACQLIKSSYE